VEGTPFGKYRLVELLGRGGMGEVWRAFDTATDRIVALKVLPAHLADDDVFQKRFRREARTAAGLYEPHVVPIHGYGEIDGRLYVDMRLIVGRDLEAVLREGSLDPARAVMIVEQVASALHAAHQIGLIHRDVKPSNILLTDSDFAYLIDFGIARVAGETGLTTTGSTIGTWAYMAPERFGTGEADHRSDVYALACVLHQCLTGQLPFAGQNVEQQVAGHLTTPPPQPSAIAPGVPHAFDGVIAVGMAKNPDERYTSTRELAQAAQAALMGTREPAPQHAADTPTHAGPTVSASNAPTQQAPISASNDRIPIPQVATFAAAPVPDSGSKRPNRLAMILLGAAALLIVVSVVVVAISLGSRSSPGGGVASPTSTLRSTPATSSLASRSVTPSPSSVTTAASPAVVEGWGAGDALAKEFQGLLPATPNGVGYRGVKCYTSTESIFPGGVKIACGGARNTMGQLELEPDMVNGCRFNIEGYPAGDDVMQHFYDLAPSMNNAPVEQWRRGNQTGNLRYGMNGSSNQLVATFDDPARRNSLLYVTCANQQPYDDWWPNAPL
jgi:serine/threonine protein kinase